MKAITDLIVSGLLKDLHTAERTFYLSKSINESQKKLVPGIKTDISNILFDLTYTEMVLSLCRLYDTPSKKHSTRCIKQLYELIRKDEFKTDLKVSKQEIFQKLSVVEWESDLEDILGLLDLKDLNKNVIIFFETIAINDPINSSLLNLKQIRDKLLGHNEDIKLDTFIPFNSFTVLINHVKDVLSFFSLAYSGVNLVRNGKFYLTHSALDWRRTYKSFLAQNSG